eukprot:SAG25_NODE_4435_length_815_cov_4.328228_1_plen_75_part_10
MPRHSRTCHTEKILRTLPVSDSRACERITVLTTTLLGRRWRMYDGMERESPRTGRPAKRRTPTAQAPFENGILLC